MQDRKKGQLIYTYGGEITNEEVNRSSESRAIGQVIHMIELNKWLEDEGVAQYICDGMPFGGPTGFINHSCDPNCGIFTQPPAITQIAVFMSWHSSLLGFIGRD